MPDCQISVRVTPRSGRDEVLGWQDGVLRVRVRAAPVDGRANEAVCRLLAKQLGVPVSAVEVAGGASSRTKTLRVAGLSREEVKARLEAGSG
jgi:uncharacterized protein (TIGR00251 family)